MTERLDEQKLAQVRAWADSLLADERPELRAAARGLLMMADEVERLWAASRTAVAADIGSALAERLGTGTTEPSPSPVEAVGEGAGASERPARRWRFT
jgi:hypothetical protein